jgi:hypothetical protein
MMVNDLPWEDRTSDQPEIDVAGTELSTGSVTLRAGRPGSSAGRRW